MPPLIRQLLSRLHGRPLEREELLQLLDTALGIEPATVYAATILAGPRVQAEHWHLGGSRCRADMLWDTKDTVRLEIRSRHDPGSRESETKYVVYGVRHEARPDVVTLLAFKDRMAFYDGIRRLVHFNKRDLIPPALSDRRFRQVLEAFQGVENLSGLIVTRASVRLRMEVPAERSQVGFTSVAWPGVPLTQAFHWVWDNNGWFRTLSFDAFRGHHEVGRFSLGRRGEVTATQRFSTAFRSLCVPVANTFEEDERAFGHRARRELKFREVRPLAIEYGRGVFTDSNAVRRFVAALRIFPHGVVSVYHGNPYLHAAILDQVDGSSTELWITSAGRILLVPQMRATVWGLKRVVQHIYDTFAEGEVADVKLPA